MKKILATLLGLWAVPAAAQSPISPDQFLTEIRQKLPTNNTGAISATVLRQVLTDQVNNFALLGVSKNTSPWQVCLWGTTASCTGQLGTINPSTGVFSSTGGGGVPGGTAGQVQSNAGGVFGGFTVGGDATLDTILGTLTIKPAVITASKLASGAALTNLGLSSAPIASDTRAVANGVATLDGSGFVPIGQLPPAVAGGLAFEGSWNATTNDPTLVDGAGTTGQYYFVSVSGSTTLNGVSSWTVGDLVLRSSGAWNKIPGLGGAAGVTSIGGTLTGAVSIASLKSALAYAWADFGYTPLNKAGDTSTGVYSFAGLTLAPASMVASPNGTGPLAITGTMTGSIGAANYQAASLDVSDSVVSSQFVYPMTVVDRVTGVGATGNRPGFTSSTFLQVTPTTSMQFMAGGSTVFSTNVNNGGTNGANLGNGYGHSSNCTLSGGATFWSSCIGYNASMFVNTGSSVARRIGFQAESDGNLRGTGVDAAFDVWGGTTQWLTGLLFDDSVGGAATPGGTYPIATGGTLIRGSRGDAAGPSLDAGINFGMLSGTFTKDVIVLPANTSKGISWGYASEGGMIHSMTASGSGEIDFVTGGMKLLGTVAVPGLPQTGVATAALCSTNTGALFLKVTGNCF